MNDAGNEIKEITVVILRLYQKIGGRQFLCRIAEFFIIFPLHRDIGIIVPRYKILVSYGAQKCSRIEKISDIMLFAKRCDFL